MSSYKQNDLTEEIFGHLCNVALHKCSDKSEKKRAGCGGRAMRKRFVNTARPDVPNLVCFQGSDKELRFRLVQDAQETCVES